MDPGMIEVAMQDRLATLGQLEDKAIAGHLKKELEEARGTLLHPNKRDAYDQLLERERLVDLKKLVPALLENKVLSAAAEKVITAHTAAVGLDLRRIAMAIGEALREAGATRAPRSEPTADAIAQASTALRIALRPIADQRLEAALTEKGIEIPPPPPAVAEPEPAPAPEPEPATAPVVRPPTQRNVRPPEPAPPPNPARPPTQRNVRPSSAPGTGATEGRPATQRNVRPPDPEPEPAKPPTQRNVVKEDPPTRTTTRATVPVKKPTTIQRAPAPEPEPEPMMAEPDTPEGRMALKITELNQKVASLERTKAIQSQNIAGFEPEMERMSKKLRRTTRSLIGLLAPALAFIAGHLARLAPGVAEAIDKLTLTQREQMVQFQNGGTIGAIAGGVAVALYLVVVIFSGSEKKAAFLVPTILLSIAALFMGLAFLR